MESEDAQNVNQLIKAAYDDLFPFLSEVSKHAAQNTAVLDIAIYEEKVTSTFNIELSKRSIGIIDKLHAKLSITFVDF